MVNLFPGVPVEDSPMEIDKVQAEWMLGLFPAEQLPEFAAQAMVQGLDGPFIMELVSFHRPTVHDIKPEVFNGALREMGRAPITQVQAVRRLAHPVALRILRNQTTPFDGASEIARLANRCPWERLSRNLRDFEVWLECVDEGAVSRVEAERSIIELAWSLVEEDPAR